MVKPALTSFVVAVVVMLVGAVAQITLIKYAGVVLLLFAVALAVLARSEISQRNADHVRDRW